MSSSICSSMSNVTVSAFGEEMPLEEAVDAIFKDIQEHLNELHVQIRLLCMAEEHNESYEDAFEYYHHITEHIKEGQGLFKELPKVMKQILPKRPKELPKGWEKAYTPRTEIHKPNAVSTGLVPEDKSLDPH
jgi:hypothetical protein